jgi:hypothetical protein
LNLKKLKAPKVSNFRFSASQNGLQVVEKTTSKTFSIVANELQSSSTKLNLMDSGRNLFFGICRGLAIWDAL